MTHLWVALLSSVHWLYFLHLNKLFFADIQNPWQVSYNASGNEWHTDNTLLATCDFVSQTPSASLELMIEMNTKSIENLIKVNRLQSCCTKVLLSSSGQASSSHSYSMGIYENIGAQTYKHESSSNRYLYFEPEYGGWKIAHNTEETFSFIKSNQFLPQMSGNEVNCPENVPNSLGWFYTKDGWQIDDTLSISCQL